MRLINYWEAVVVRFRSNQGCMWVTEMHYKEASQCTAVLCEGDNDGMDARILALFSSSCRPLHYAPSRYLQAGLWFGMQFQVLERLI